MSNIYNLILILKSKLNGARIVRVATHPAALKMGYGSKTIELL